MNPGEQPDAARPSGLRHLHCRTEAVLLGVAATWTVGAKGLVIRNQKPDDLAGQVVEAILPDVVFFAASFLVLTLVLLLLRGRPRLAGRLTLVGAGLVLGWSIANSAWLIATNVQLQPSVLGVLLREPGEFWPVVQAHLEARPGVSIPIVITILVGVGWFVFRVLRPPAIARSRRTLGAWCAAWLVIGAGAAVWHVSNERAGRLAFSGQVLGFSSHWYAMRNMVGRLAPPDDVSGRAREVPRIEEGNVTWPAPGADPPARPNVVVVFLESVSYESSSLAPVDATRERPTTPFLATLAGEGTEFVETRVPVPQTSKAWWTALTGVVPDLEPDAAETVLVDRPYQSLASVLGERGYRSAFFEMSRGSFECAPGLFANLGFDWAWFRENLEDESAHLGYMNGDDFRMIPEMFDWVDGGDAPFLLTMISTVAHDPFELPGWYEHEPSDDRYERYLEAVRFTDAWLEKVCAELRARDLLDDTILCVLGDHGEGFRPEGGTGRWAPFEEIIRVPWVIRWPGHVEAGARVEPPVSQLDVTPTLLSLLGADTSAARFEGRNAFEPGAGDRRFHFMSWYRRSPVGYVEGDRKVVWWPYTNSLFAYDLAADPGEREPRTLAGEEKDAIVADLEAWLRGARLVIPAQRFRERMTYDHWRTVSSGRYAWAYYLPSKE